MKTDLFEQLRLLCYSKAEVAKIIGITKSRIYAISTGTKNFTEVEEKKILQIIAGGKNQKFVNRSILIQKAAKEHKKAIAHNKKI